MICDFCSSPEVKWAYPAYDFVDVGSMTASEGAWAACDACSDLIECGERERLIDRTVKTFPEKSIPEDVVRAYVQALHSAFYSFRKGPREAIA